MVQIPTIAILEDDVAVAETLADLVLSNGYQPKILSDGAAFLEFLETTTPSLVLLDRQLPDGDGITLVSNLTEREIPTIILTGKGSEIDRVSGLEIGADDYIVKPFSVHEVAARIRAVLRRSKKPSTHRLLPETSSENIDVGYRFEGWAIDTERRSVRDPEEELVDLTVAEFDLLLAIVSANGRVLTRNQILDLTHRTDDEVFDRTIDVLMFRLRRKIEVNPQIPKFLLTERGVGYRFGANVEAVSIP